ncbi:CAAX prenyl protease-related protein [Verrucomicrobiota bacterium sgz303538]
MFGLTTQEKAYIGPFVVFLGLIALGQFVAWLGEGFAAWYLAAPHYWVYPLQTLVCGALLARYWRQYQMEKPRGIVFSILIGIVVLGIWVAPQVLGIQVLGLGAPRTEGFEPHFFGGGAAYAANVAVRFVRLVIVVPLVEEIFWRGFLLRYVIRHDFLSVPFGTFDWRSFAIVTIGFCLEHQTVDWPAAILAGALYNLVAYRTRSLSACVLAHAVTNLFLGFYVLRTGQWGFW